MNHPSLPEHPDHALVQSQMGGRASGILSFGLKEGGREAGARVLDVVDALVDQAAAHPAAKLTQAMCSICTHVC